MYYIGDRMFIHEVKAFSKENVEKEPAKRLACPYAPRFRNSM